MKPIDIDKAKDELIAGLARERELRAELERLRTAQAELLTACNAMRLEMAAYGAQHNWPPSMPRGYVLALNAGRRAIALADGEEGDSNGLS